MRLPLLSLLFIGASTWCALAMAAPEAALRERILFDADWKFFRGDAPDAAGTLDYKTMRPWVLATGVDLLNAGATKPQRAPGNPGEAVSFVQPGFDDSSWKTVRLPHDWGIEGPFNADLPGDTGKLPWAGVGWYRKQFTVDPADASKRLALDIDGAMAYSSVWLNGHYIGGWPYGYTSYRLDLTPFIKMGESNVLAIRLDNPADSSRWYPGSGLYRHVWLVKTPATRIKHWGVAVTTPRISAETALVQVDVYLENSTETKTTLKVSTRIHELDTAGVVGSSPVATSRPMTLELDPAKAREGMRSLAVSVPQPKLWDLQHRQRYVAITTVESSGAVIDQESTPFGIRKIEVTSDNGLLLNGKRVTLNGVCLHHDQGALGTAVHTRALERQLELLQSMGCNAIRTSHNPPAPELLDLCDRMGFLVMDEAFDCWRRGKKKAEVAAADPYDRYFDYARVFDEWHERDLRALIRRDRNHPSIVLWSIGNEVIEQWTEDGWPLAAHLAGIVREEDRSRPITGAFNNKLAGYTGFQTALDVMGYNYNPEEYLPFHEANPTVPVFGSETASTTSSRGEYYFPLEPGNKLHGRANFQVSSYDLSTPQWALLPDKEWLGLDKAPFALGEFVWTGFDYLGEPTPYNTDLTNLLNFSNAADQAKAKEELDKLGRIRPPSRSSYFGIIDLAGFPKDRFYLYQARWRPDLRMAHIVPHWNWPDRVDQMVPVYVYSSADEAELFVNGRSFGRKKREPSEYRFHWNYIKYTPGEVKVVTYKNGQPWAEAVTRTTGEPARVLLAPDHTELRPDGTDLSFIAVSVVDKDGQVVPRTHNLVTFAVEGPADIVAVDNGDATSFEPFQAKERKVFNGLALVVLRSRVFQTGLVTLRAASDGLEPAEIKLRVKP